MDDNKDLTARIDRLLRTRECLTAAAPLIGKVAVRYRPAPPPKAAKLKPNGKPEEESGEVTAKPPGPPRYPSPWHKAAVVQKCSEVDLNGGKWLAKVTIDSGCWDRLNEAGKDAALVIALRGLRHSETADGADKVSIEKPPIRCWPDTRAEAVEVMGQLGPDGAEGAALVGALAEADDVANLEEAVARIVRRLSAGQSIASMYQALHWAHERMGTALATRPVTVPNEGVHLRSEIEEQDEPSDNGPSADIEAA